jgi:hypothetical protein
MRTAKACGPDTSVLVSRSREAIPAGDGGKKADHRGELAISCKPLRAGLPGDSGASAVNTRGHLCYQFRPRGCGCIVHPASRTPSVLRGRRFLENLGRIAPRDRERVSVYAVIAMTVSRDSHCRPREGGTTSLRRGARAPTAVIAKGAATGQSRFCLRRSINYCQPFEAKQEHETT